MFAYRTFQTKIFMTVIVLLAAACAQAADWPGYRCDKTRSGGTSEQVGSSFSLEWVHSSVYAPRPAWSAPADRPREGFSLRHRVGFDDAFQVAAVARAPDDAPRVHSRHMQTATAASTVTRRCGV